MIPAGFDGFGLVVVPLLIFGARILDVSLGTLRVALITRDMRWPSAVVGFAESLIWLLVISNILRHLSLPIYYLAYAAGFGAGNYVGITIERRLALGSAVLRVITTRPIDELLDALRAEGLGATVIPAQGMTGPVQIVQTVLPRRLLEPVLDRVEASQPKAFFTIEPVARVDQGVFPSGRRRGRALRLRQRK
jgi:uncharacterized protein YebE (UPF0316 family)